MLSDVFFNKQALTADEWIRVTRHASLLCEETPPRKDNKKILSGARAIFVLAFGPSPYPLPVRPARPGKPRREGVSVAGDRVRGASGHPAHSVPRQGYRA